MPPRASFQRRGVASRDARNKLLIVCEGVATERKYFEEARISLRLPKELVQVVHPNATDPRTLVQAAKDLMRDQDWKAGDQAWAVFDGDEHRHDDASRANWNDAIQLAEGGADMRRRVYLAVSNPCFELWYLLHFQNQNAHLHRDRAKVRLREHLPDYEKPNVLWELLQPQLSGAVTRAEALIERIERDGLERFANPSTRVHLLVSALRALKSR